MFVNIKVTDYDILELVKGSIMAMIHNHYGYKILDSLKFEYLGDSAALSIKTKDKSSINIYIAERQHDNLSSMYSIVMVNTDGTVIDTYEVITSKLVLKLVREHINTIYCLEPLMGEDDIARYLIKKKNFFYKVVEFVKDKYFRKKK